MSAKRAARLLPWLVLAGTMGVGVLALDWVHLASARAFEYALAGCCCFFATRYFHRRFRTSMRPVYATADAKPRKLSPMQKRDRRRAIRKATRMVRMPGR